MQLLVMLVLSLPLCCFATETEQAGTSPGVSVSAAAGAVDDACPCCPDEGGSDSDNCSACSTCSTYTFLLPQTCVKYAPSEAQLVSRNGSTNLLEVHIPIFVPPQNHA